MEVQELPQQDAKLAIDGGKPVRTAPLPTWPRFDAETITAVGDVLASGRVNYWTGERGRLFEEAFADVCGAQHGIALANGSVAIELALKAIGLKPGDEVITTCRSFMASASSIVVCGGRVVFADVDSATQNITAGTVAPLVTDRTRAIIAVHHAGLPCDLDPLLDLAARHDLVLIEDCAQAHGALYKGRPVGSIGHIGCWSFCQDKIMTTGGEGGFLTTNDPETWRRAWSYKDHGKNPDKVFMADPPPGFRFLHDSFGTNWRMTEMQAAIGLRQIDRLAGWHERRTANAAALSEGFADLAALDVPAVPEWAEHGWYRFYAFVQPDKLAPGWDRDRIKAAVRAEGVFCDTGTCPEMYREEAFAGTDMRPAGRLPQALDLGLRSLFFQVHPELDAADMADVVAAVRKVMAVATA